jgi:hypothetical protein
LAKFQGDARIIKRGKRQIAKFGLDLFYLLEIVGLAARAQSKKILARFVTGNERMKC